jgi:hypothetical protein
MNCEETYDFDSIGFVLVVPFSISVKGLLISIEESSFISPTSIASKAASSLEFEHWRRRGDTLTTLFGDEGPRHRDTRVMGSFKACSDMTVAFKCCIAVKRELA